MATVKRYRDAARRRKTAETTETPLVHKMWILPDASIQPLSQWHWSWLQNHPDVYEKFGIKGDASKMDEGMGRRMALQVGFVRVNYEMRNGHLTVECCRKFFSAKVKDAIFRIVLDNARKIDHITINLFDPEVETLDSTGASSVFRLRSEEKVEHIPFISESSQGKALRIVLKEGIKPKVKVAAKV